MKFTKIVAVLLSVILLTLVFTGCNQTAKSPFVSASASPAADTAGTTDASGVSPEATALNFAGAYASLPPDTVMMTINGNKVTWSVLFYYINYVVYQIESQGGSISDWSAAYSDETTYQDYVLTSAANLAQQYAALQYGADQLKLTLTDADKTAIQSDWDQEVQSAGSEEAFLAQLQSLYCSKDLFMQISGISHLAQDCFASMYGADGSKVTDADVADSTAQDGYMMVKHILFMTGTVDETGTLTPMSDADKATVHKKADAVLTQLKNYKGTDFNTYFDSLMNQYSEDKDGLSSFPDGYLFKSGDLYTEVETATKALEIGGFSQDLVETQAGYEILYRIPLNYDVTPLSASSSGSYSLRLITARNMFGAVADTWLSSLKVTYSDQYKALDFTKIFAKG